MTANLWGAVEVSGVTLPIFLGHEYAQFPAAWRAVDETVQLKYWMLGAIAVRLERASGGRPDRDSGRSNTVVQNFCKDVGIDRQTFQRYNRTYSTFVENHAVVETRTTGCTRFIQQLSFKHFEVAARLAEDDPGAAIAEAHEKGWSANRLERELAARLPRSPKPFVLKHAVRQLWQLVQRWPLPARKKLPALLRHLADDVEANLPSPSDLWEVPDHELIGHHDMAVAS